MTRESRETIGRNALQLALGLGLSQVLVAVIYLFAARSGEPSQFGEVVLLISVAMVINALIDWGGTAHALRQYASGQLSERALGCWMRGRLVWGCAAGVLLVAGASAVTQAPNATLAQLGVLVPAALLPGPATIPWRKERRFGLVSINSVVARIPCAGVAAGGAAAGMPVYSWLPGLLAVSMAIEGFVAAASRNLLMRRGVTWNPWQGTLRLGSSSAVLSLQGLDIPIVGGAAGAEAAGTYGAVNRWTAPIGLMATAFSQSAFPAMAAASNGRQALRALRRGVPFLLLAAVGVALVVLLAGPMADLLLGQAYAGSADVLRVLALAVLVSMVNQPLYAYLIARYRDALALRSVSIALGAQLCCTWVLALQMGSVGGALGFMLGQTILLALLAMGVANSSDDGQVHVEEVVRGEPALESQ